MALLGDTVTVNAPYEILILYSKVRAMLALTNPNHSFLSSQSLAIFHLSI